MTKKKGKPKDKYILVAKPSKPDFSKEAIERMMGKQKKGKKPMKKKAKAPHKDLFHLTNCLRLTERNIKNDGTDLDEFFKGQAAKIRKELESIT